MAPSSPVDDVAMATLLKRYDNMKLFDTHKNSLFEVRNRPVMRTFEIHTNNTSRIS